LTTEILKSCRLESSLADAVPENRFKFKRLGHFCLDAKASSEKAPVFSRTVTLWDVWARSQKR